MIKYVLTEQGKEKVDSYIRELEAKRKEILDAEIDSADETDLPTAEDILSEIEDFIDDEGDYINCWGVTDNYNADNPIVLKFVEDFQDINHIVPEGNARVFDIIESYSKDNYGDMHVGTTVMDTTLHVCWNVISKDGENVTFQTVKGGVNGAKMTVNADNCTFTFVLLGAGK